MKLTQIAALCALASTAAVTQAAPIWQDFSLTGLYGENYAVPLQVMTTNRPRLLLNMQQVLSMVIFLLLLTVVILTLVMKPISVAPRLSLGAVTGQKLELGPLKTFLSRQLGKAALALILTLITTYMVLFLHLIFHTKLCEYHFYKADNDDTPDDYQMTITYAVPFKIGSEEFLADAFLDWSTAEKNGHASELNWTSQYKWNVGKHISPETKLYLGIEHSVWNNKYAIKGLDQHDVSALVKYHF